MRDYLYQMEPDFDDEDVHEVAQCIRSTWVMEAERTTRFEAAFASYVGSTFAVAVPSCTVALAISLMALGIEPGDEVIIPDLTFIATANAVNLVGGIPVLVDIDPETFGLDMRAVEQAVTPRTRVIIPVWLNGRSPNIQSLVKFAEVHGLSIVEDAACALGSRWLGQHAGTFGKLGCFSFNTTKIITTGTGGMIVTDDPTLYEQVERLKNHGRLDRRDYHPMIGFNFCFSDLLAALGLTQMQKLPQRVAHKTNLFYWYYERLQKLPGIEMIPPQPGECLWYPDVFVHDPVELKTFLETQHIQTRLFYPPIHTQPCYQRAGDFNNATAVAKRGLWLPAASYLSEKEVEQVCQAISQYFICNQNRKITSKRGG